jgi:hypothetical protein
MISRLTHYLFFIFFSLLSLSGKAQGGTSSKRANLCISPSSINIANADYGTGNYRAIGLQ